LCGTWSFISINNVWSFLDIKMFATVEAKYCLLISVLIELTEVLTLCAFFGENWCSGLGFDVVFRVFGFFVVLGVVAGDIFFCFCTLFHWIDWWMEELFKAGGFLNILVWWACGCQAYRILSNSINNEHITLLLLETMKNGTRETR